MVAFVLQIKDSIGELHQVYQTQWNIQGWGNGHWMGPWVQCKLDLGQDFIHYLVPVVPYSKRGAMMIVQNS